MPCLTSTTFAPFSVSLTCQRCQAWRVNSGSFSRHACDVIALGLPAIKRGVFPLFPRPCLRYGRVVRRGFLVHIRCPQRISATYFCRCLHNALRNFGLADLAVSGLDVLAGQRSCAARQADAQTASALCSVRWCDASGRYHLRANWATGRACLELPGQRMTVMTMNPTVKVEASAGRRVMKIRTYLEIGRRLPSERQLNEHTPITKQLSTGQPAFFRAAPTPST